MFQQAHFIYKKKSLWRLFDYIETQVQAGHEGALIQPSQPNTNHKLLFLLLRYHIEFDVQINSPQSSTGRKISN